jgi:hypothetical protein
MGVSKRTTDKPRLPQSNQPPIEVYGSKEPAKHVHYFDQWPGAGQRHGTQGLQPETKLEQEVDGILTPNSGDLTVYLTMDLQEDLEDQLDELTRLSRLGHFSSAKEFFNENLQHYVNNPYVLVQYANLLLHQGDFKSVTLLKDDVIYKREAEQPNSEELEMLRVNWELMQILAKSHTLDTVLNAPDVFEDVIGVLEDIAESAPPGRPNISSTEVSSHSSS